MTEAYTAEWPHSRQIPPDDLPGNRLDEALALRRFLKHYPLRWFVENSYSGKVLLDLESIGLVKLHRVQDGAVLMLAVVMGSNR
jgi:hypothetical protein